MNDQRGKKRKKKYYKQCGAKKSRRHELEGGMCGFLLTCNKREKDTVREAYSLLNEYADRLYGPEQTADRGADGSSSESDEEDIEKVLQKEVTAIKDVSRTERRFQVVDTGANNVLFIRTTLDDPHKLAHTIMSDIFETKKSRSRHIMRFLPVVGTCKSHDTDKILKCAKDALTPFLGGDEGHSFSILFKARNNNKVTRNDILRPLAQIIFDMNAANQTDYQSPDFVINIDVVRSVCCVSVAKDFYKFSKYNLQEVATVKEPVKKRDDGSSQVQAVDVCKVDEVSKTECESEPAGVTEQTAAPTTEQTDLSSSVSEPAPQSDVKTGAPSGGDENAAQNVTQDGATTITVEDVPVESCPVSEDKKDPDLPSAGVNGNDAA